MQLLEAGTIIRDTYEVERFLGEGAFAEVYRVKHRFLGRQAMKVFKRAGISLEDMHEMLGEATLLSRIGHPNIVRVFDANTLTTPRGECGYFTMENVSGGSLQKFWQSHGNQFVPVETSLDLIKQVCRGMALAHSENPPIIHRDIKPQNILVGYETDGLRARVSDFGLAKKVNPLTLLATTAGTLSFKPPETFTERRADSPASDVWAIGATLYMLLTDRLPLDLQTGSTLRAKEMHDTPIVSPSNINPEVNHSLDAIVMKALNKQVSNRYPGAQALLDALEHLDHRVPALTGQKRNMESEPSKAIFGLPTAADESEADVLVERAFKASKAGRLNEAADLMEEAFNRSPNAREIHSRQVKLWRCGISM
jgi:eukaryotic-like serine/threonine-protein kinase